MAERTTIARPYAQAVFELAAREQRLAQWSEMLALLTAVASEPRMRLLIGNPRITQDQLTGLFLDICGDALSRPAQALVGLLVENRRLDLLPEISTLYETYRAEAEKIVRAEVTSAFPLSETQQADIAAALKRRLGREVHLSCATDDALIGGAVIRAGDLVIDGSVRGHLARLAGALAH